MNTYNGNVWTIDGLMDWMITKKMCVQKCLIDWLIDGLNDYKTKYIQDKWLNDW